MFNPWRTASEELTPRERLYVHDLARLLSRKRNGTFLAVALL